MDTDIYGAYKVHSKPENALGMTDDEVEILNKALKKIEVDLTQSTLAM